jgi:hypothetical protein
MIKAILIGLIFSCTLMAREPAIEPTFGLSIDEMAEVSPQDARGFNFSGSATSDKVTLPRSDFDALIVLLSLLIVTPTILMVSLNIAKKRELSLRDKDKDSDFVLVLEDYKKELEEKDKLKKVG